MQDVAAVLICVWSAEQLFIELKYFFALSLSPGFINILYARLDTPQTKRIIGMQKEHFDGPKQRERNWLRPKLLSSAKPRIYLLPNWVDNFKFFVCFFLFSFSAPSHLMKILQGTLIHATVRPLVFVDWKKWLEEWRKGNKCSVNW